MEDKIVEEQPMICEFSTGTTLLNSTLEFPSNTADQSKPETTEDIYELQKQYYFGAASTDPIDEESKQQVSGKSYREEVEELEDSDEEADFGEQMAFPSPRRQSSQ